MLYIRHIVLYVKEDIIVLAKKTPIVRALDKGEESVSPNLFVEIPNKDSILSFQELYTPYTQSNVCSVYFCIEEMDKDWLHAEDHVMIRDIDTGELFVFLDDKEDKTVDDTKPVLMWIIDSKETRAGCLFVRPETDVLFPCVIKG